MRVPPRVHLLLLVALTAASLAVAGPAALAADDLEKLRSERVDVQGDLDAITAELEQITVRITEAQEARERLTEEVRALEAEAEVAGDILAERAVQAWKTRSTGPMELLLVADRPAEAMARARLLDGMGRRERETVERAELARAALAQRRMILNTTLADLRRDEARVAELRAELDEAFRIVWAQEQELASRRDRQRRVSRSGQQGVYACPIAQPFHFRDSWGAPRSGGRRHKGVDIFGPMGADVYAITHGTILRHSSSRLGGIGLYLQGDDGNQYYYAHLQEILPGYGPGRRVEAGELIALNGSTGNATVSAPHIHFEIRPGGGPQVNPYPYTAAACF